MTDIRKLLERANALAREFRRTRVVPECIVCSVYDDDNAEEIERYVEAVQARFAEDVHDLLFVIIAYMFPRPAGLRAPWHTPRWWLDCVPTEERQSNSLADPRSFGP